MNLELTDEQTFLREAARDALSRVKTVAAARDALEDPAALPDLWPTACEAGWPGLLVSEERGGAGLSAFDAMLVMTEAGRVLAGVPLLGHLPASARSTAPGTTVRARSPRVSCERASSSPGRPATSGMAGRWSLLPARRGVTRRCSPRTGR